MVRRGIILTINWAALDCVIAGERRQRRGRSPAGGTAFPGHHCDGCEDAPHGWGGDDHQAAERGLWGQVYYSDRLWGL